MPSRVPDSGRDRPKQPAVEREAMPEVEQEVLRVDEEELPVLKLIVPRSWHASIPASTKMR